MATTYKLISSVTVGAGGTSSIDFTSIPQTYTDLVILLSTRNSETANVWGKLSVSINGVTTNRSNRYLYGTGSGAGSAYDTVIELWTSSSSATANIFGSTSIYISNYTGSNAKSFSIETLSENAGNAALTLLNAGLWNSTDAITSLSFANSPYTISQYSTAYLYGIKNS